MIPKTYARRPQIPWGIVIGVASAVTVAALGYYHFDNEKTSSERHRILKERDSLAKEIAADYSALRTSVESWTLGLAGEPFAGELVDPDARHLGWRERPTVYLRMRRAEATSTEAIHQAARLSSLDALSSCLLRSKGPGPWSYGDIVYRAEMLGRDFIKDVRETGNDLRLRNLAYALDQYREHDFPEARDGSKYSEFAVIALDEDPPTIPTKSAAFGEDASVSQRILSTPHPIRLSLRRVADGRELLRVRRTPDAVVLQVQGDAVVAGAGVELRRAQAMSCSMAQETLEVLGVAGGPDFGSKPAPLPVAAPPAVVTAPSAAAPSASSAPASAASGAMVVPTPSTSTR